MTPSAAKPTANTVRPTRWAPAGTGTLASCAARYALADRQTPVPITRHCRQSPGGAASSSAASPAPRDAAASPGSITCPCSAGAAARAEPPGRSTPGAAGPAECAGAGITLRGRTASLGLRLLLAPLHLGKASLLPGLLFQGLQRSSLLLLLGQESLVVLVQVLLGPGSLLQGLGLAAVLRQRSSLSLQV